MTYEQMPLWNLDLNPEKTTCNGTYTKISLWDIARLRLEALNHKIYDPPWLFTSKAVPKSAESQLTRVVSAYGSLKNLSPPKSSNSPLSCGPSIYQPLKCCKNTTPIIKWQTGEPIWLSSWQPTKWRKTKKPPMTSQQNQWKSPAFALEIKEGNTVQDNLKNQRNHLCRLEGHTCI